MFDGAEFDRLIGVRGPVELFGREGRREGR